MTARCFEDFHVGQQHKSDPREVTERDLAAFTEVTFELTRYDVGGRVTDRDVEVAKKISSVYRART